jgi:protein TonB
VARTPSDRIRRGIAAGLVVLAHAALGWLFLSTHAVRTDENREPAEPVIVAFIEKPTPRNLSFGPVPVQVRTENVLHLQRLAPRIQDIPVEEPDPATTPVTVPMPASAPLPEQARAGLNGEAIASSAQSGGGNFITLLQRVIPRYPAAAARRHETGATQAMLRVDTSGRVTDVKIVRSSGSRSLDDAAVEAFRQWRFAPVPEASVPGGLWVTTEQRFIFYRFKYFRLADRAAEAVSVGAVQPATNQMTPGSLEALRRFIGQVSAGTFDEADLQGRAELRKMREALEDWGAVQSIEFTGTAGPRSWTAYRVRPDEREGLSGSTVEVKWNLFEVRHQNATTEWLIAVDRRGTIWAARASPAPWQQVHSARDDGSQRAAR